MSSPHLAESQITVGQLQGKKVQMELCKGAYIECRILSHTNRTDPRYVCESDGTDENSHRLK